MQAPLVMRAGSILMRASLDLLGGMCINLFVHVAIGSRSSLPQPLLVQIFERNQLS